MSILLKRGVFNASIKRTLTQETVCSFKNKFYTDFGTNNKNQSNEDTTKSKKLYFLTGTGLAFGVAYNLLSNDNKKTVFAGDLKKFGSAVQGLPTYSMEEVSKHSDKSKVWVTYNQGVYDITKFITQHPGGDKIMMAAGGSLEPFWLLYSVHNRDEVLSMLEQYRIGNLAESDVLSATDASDPYSKDPRRHPVLKPASSKPFNAEPPPELLVERFLTPQDVFYVRNHLPVPDISEKNYELEIEGIGIKKVTTLTMKDIKKMPSVTVTATVQCAGNRRSEMTKVKPVKGLNWNQGAIGNAKWTGVKLCDLLKKLGVSENSEALHVQFEGMDLDPASMPYGASIPIEKAMDPNGGVILAYMMNGEPLNRDHGYPLRVIVPGVTGARSVKWLGRIVVSTEESDSHWQQRDYKGFSPSVDWDTVDFSKSPAIQELPVTSAICTPANGETVSLKNGKLLVKGYAWSGGGRKIVRVDITADKGMTWQTAELKFQDPSKHPTNWAWTLWEKELDMPRNIREPEIWVKAIDSSYNTQPEEFKNIWNLRGVLSNAYHKIKVKIG